MNVQEKGWFARLRGSRMAWAVLLLVVCGTLATVVVGMELYAVTGHATRYNTQ